jgi:hypothetical protein
LEEEVEEAASTWGSASPEGGFETATDVPPLLRCRVERFAWWIGILIAIEVSANAAKERVRKFMRWEGKRDDWER